MLAHERLIVLQRRLEQRHVVNGADVAQHHCRIARESAPLRALQGQRMKRALNSRWLIVRNSHASMRASRESNPARAAKAGSRNSLPNDAFHGHTSWEVCRHSRFLIQLATGSLTPVKVWT